MLWPWHNTHLAMSVIVTDVKEKKNPKNEFLKKI